jgi:hypothetical protein
MCNHGITHHVSTQLLKNAVIENQGFSYCISTQTDVRLSMHHFSLFIYFAHFFLCTPTFGTT